MTPYVGRHRWSCHCPPETSGLYAHQYGCWRGLASLPQAPGKHRRGTIFSNPLALSYVDKGDPDKSKWYHDPISELFDELRLGSES